MGKRATQTMKEMEGKLHAVQQEACIAKERIETVEAAIRMLCLLPVPCLGCAGLIFLVQRVARAGPGCLYCRLMRASRCLSTQPATYSQFGPTSAFASVLHAASRIMDTRGARPKYTTEGGDEL